MSSLSSLERNRIILPGSGGYRPPLKWAGGKRWLVGQLRDFWLNHKDARLVEPFCGGLAVTLGLIPKEALLNDINEHAINFYNWLKDGLKITVEMNNNEVEYYRHRQRFNDLIAAGKGNSKQAAELFYYLNRTGYNGLCRFNRSGGYNVPFGKYGTINYVRDFGDYRKILAGWQFSASDFAKIKLKKGDFVYADPPYDVEFRQYSKEGFGWDDQVRLAQWLRNYDGPVILSNQATKRIIELYQDLDFDIYYVDAPRMISCTGDRAKAREIVATRGIVNPQSARIKTA
jgi:DNA adenine methylase